MPLTAGTKLGHYRILGPLGSGGMGEVYRARDETLGREVAVKVLPESLLSNATARQRFEREARTVAGLSHANILTIHDFGSEGGTAYAVTELLEGEDLRALLKSEATLDVDEVIAIARAVATGLSVAHQRGVVHRDIKPANVFRTGDGEVKILDFGLARVDSPDEAEGAGDETLEAGTTPGAVLGTVGYMSPEQVRGQPATPASDVFSFGCLLYEMLAGRRPFDRGSSSDTLAAILRDHPDPPDIVATKVGRPLGRILERCLEKDPTARYPSATPLLADLDRVREERRLEAVEATAALHLLRRPVVLASVAIVVVLLSVLFAANSRKRSRERWAREEALPHIEELAGSHRYEEAYRLAEEVEAILPTDPQLDKLWPRIAGSMSVVTDPTGAQASYRPYSGADAEWRELGTTPVEAIRVPRGPFRWRIEKGGYRTVEVARRVVDPALVSRQRQTAAAADQPLDAGDEIRLQLEREEALPSEMVAVDAGPYALIPLTGFPLGVGLGVSLERYWIDRTEVTNAAFSEFVEAGGYETPEYWREPFVDGKRELDFDEAKRRFVDSTGRPGPSTWSIGAPADGAADLPVGGVSWFEAAAYCRFRDEELPTVVHWVRAVLPGLEIAEPMSPAIVPLSNFQSGAPVPVGTLGGMGYAGTYDQGGNVREWCVNPRRKSERYALGGAFDDPPYRFSQADAVDVWDRRASNGFRCVRYVGGEPPESMRAAIKSEEIDFYAAPRLPDEAIEALGHAYAYDPTPLNAEVLSREERGEEIVETVEVDAAYRSERLPIRLRLPANGAPPYQTVVVAPGLDVTFEGRYENLVGYDLWGLLLKSGRALVEPVYSSTLSRNDGSLAVRFSQPGAQRVLFQEWARDISRSLDYLETRTDFDQDRVAFLGFSLGAMLGTSTAYWEDRFAAYVFWSGGFYPNFRRDELGLIDLVRRVKTPLLMVNGRYDTTFTTGLQQQPLYDLWGAPDEDKRWHLTDAGHWPLPEGELIGETLDWLDRYLGPVK